MTTYCGISRLPFWVMVQLHTIWLDAEDAEHAEILETLEHLEFLTRGSNKTGKTKPA